MSATTPVSTIVNVTLNNTVTAALNGSLSLPGGNNPNFALRADNQLQILASQGTPALISFQVPNPLIYALLDSSGVTQVSLAFAQLNFSSNPELSTANVYLNSTDASVTATIANYSVKVPAYSISMLDLNNLARQSGGYAVDYTIVFTGTTLTSGQQITLTFDPFLTNEN